MKTLKFTLFLYLICSIAFAQNQQAIERLKHELANAKLDTSRVLIMNELANRYKAANPDSALFNAQKALTLARKIKYPRGEFQALYQMGFTFGVLGNYPRALEMQLKALRIAEKYNFLVDKGLVLNRLGAIYQDAKDYPKAIVFHQQAMLLLDSLHAYSLSAVSRNELARDYFLNNQPDSAQYYVQMAYDNINRWKVEWMRGHNLHEFARQQAGKGNFRIALDYFHQSLPYASVSNQYVNTARVYLGIAKIYQQTNQPDSCVFYAQKALSDAKKGNVYNEIVNACLFLSSHYEQKNEHLALYYLKIALDAKESLSNFGNSNTIQNQVAFDNQERLYEIETEKAAWLNQVRLYALLAGLGVFLIIAFILYRNNRQKQKANTILESTLSQLKSTQAQLIQSEKLASLGELTAGIAHEIQNPLNFVNNFSELSVELIEEIAPPAPDGGATQPVLLDGYNLELLGDIKQNLAKINLHGKRASSIVSGMLEHSRTSTGERTLTDINKLADEYLRLSYHGLRAKDKDFNADFTTDFDENLPKVEVISQDMGRVLLNLINNAFWAVNERRKKEETGFEPKVTVTTQLTANSQLLIAIKDNGTGMSEDIKAKIFQPFFTTKPTGQGTGLGLSLAYDIVTKGHGGIIEVESKEGEGATLIVKLPIV